MTHQSIFLAGNIQKSGLKQSAQFLQAKSIIINSSNSQYESAVSIVQTTGQSFSTQINYQQTDNNPILIIEITTLQQFENESFLPVEVFYYQTNDTIDFFNSDVQKVNFSYKTSKIPVELTISQKIYPQTIRFPLIELNFDIVKMKLSNLSFLQFLTLEVQSKDIKLIKYFGSKTWQSLENNIPFAAEILLKVVFVINILGRQHRMTLFSTKIQTNMVDAVKGQLFNIQDIQINLPAEFYFLIDLISFAQMNSEETVIVNDQTFKFANINSIGILERFCITKGAKIYDNNQKYFESHKTPYIIDRAIQKQYQQELQLLDEFIQPIHFYKLLNFSGSVFVFIDGVVHEKSVLTSFKDLQNLQKSICLIQPFTAQLDSGFTVLHKSKIDPQKIVQSTELGTGNLAIIKLKDPGNYLQIFSACNNRNFVKFFVNNQKSLISSWKDMKMHCLSYCHGKNFQQKSVQISSKSIQNGIKIGLIQYKIFDNLCLNLYVQDMFYGEKNDLRPPLLSEKFIADLAQKNSNYDVSMALSGSSLKQLDDYIEQSNVKFDFNFAKAYFGFKVQNPIFVKPAELLESYIDLLCHVLEKQKLEELQREEERMKKEEQERLKQIEEQKIKDKLEKERLEKEALRLAQEVRLSPEEQAKENELERQRDTFLRRKAEKDRLDFQVQKSLEDKERLFKLEKELLAHKLALRKERNLKFQQQQIQFQINKNGYIYQSYYDENRQEDNQNVEIRLPKRVAIERKSIVQQEEIVPEIHLIRKPKIVPQLLKESTLLKIKRDGRKQVLKPITEFISDPINIRNQTRRCVSNIEQIRSQSPYNNKQRARIGVV